MHVNGKKASESYDRKITALRSKIERQQTESDSLSNIIFAMNSFTLDSDEYALSYFEDQGLDIETLSRRIEDQLISMNKAGEDNPIIPFAGMEGDMSINKVRVINHKWILVEFTDGGFWGQLFLNYTVAPDGTVALEVKDSFLYPQSK